MNSRECVLTFTQLLEYQTAGVTGQVLTDREPLLVLDVAGQPNLHWFARKPTRLMGSYCAFPLIDDDGNVWGVLSVRSGVILCMKKLWKWTDCVKSLCRWIPCWMAGC